MKVCPAPEVLIVGDNYVISQQTARACLKYIAKSGDLPPSAKYLLHSHNSKIQLSSQEDWKDYAVQLKVLEARARYAVINLGKFIQKGIPWKDLNMECVSVSRAHIEVFVLDTFVNTISNITDSTLHRPLTKLRNLVSLLPV